MEVDKGVAVRTEIKALAAAVSTQAQVTNRIWLSLITVAVIALLPQWSSTQTPGEVNLLSFGKIDISTFHLTIFPVLVVLTIAFSGAYSQQVRAQKLAQAFLSSINSKPIGFGEVYPRELFDMLRLPTLNRVAPLAQSIRGPYQFYSRASDCPRWLRVLSTVYYISLKLTSMIVYFGLPAFALWRAYQRIRPVHSLWWFVVLGGALAAITLLQVCIGELEYTCRVIPEIWSGGVKRLIPEGPAKSKDPAVPAK